MTDRRPCRACGASLEQVFVDLGMSPLANSLLNAEQLNSMEPFYPLTTYVCHECFLVQLEMFEQPEHIFSEYSYFSSVSESWLAHCTRYAEMITQTMGLSPSSRVVEVASNDGYLLTNFIRLGIPVLGIEPAANVADVARERGVPTITKFFGSDLAREVASEGNATLLIGNNVLAHVPDLHDFVEGLSILLDRGGILTMEFPHLLRLIEDVQFDTIYHEHFSYFSLRVVQKVFSHHGLEITRVEKLPTHGGSIRIYAIHTGTTTLPSDGSVDALVEEERSNHLFNAETYEEFGTRVLLEKSRIVEKVSTLRSQGRTIAGYGAPAKGNTLLNYCNIGRDVLSVTVDSSVHKQGRYLPGSHVPVHEPEYLKVVNPDVVWILPWNLRTEIEEKLDQLSYAGDVIARVPGQGLGL